MLTHSNAFYEDDPKWYREGKTKSLLSGNVLFHGCKIWHFKGGVLVGILESAKNARSTIKTAFWSLYRRRITRLRAFCEKLKAFLRNAIGVSMTKWGVKEPLSRPQTCAKCVFRGWNHEVFRVVKSPEIGDIADYWRAQTVVKLGLLSSLRMYWTYAFVCDWIVK